MKTPEVWVVEGKRADGVWEAQYPTFKSEGSAKSMAREWHAYAGREYRHVQYFPNGDK